MKYVLFIIYCVPISVGVCICVCGYVCLLMHTNIPLFFQMPHTICRKRRKVRGYCNPRQNSVQRKPRISYLKNALGCACVSFSVTAFQFILVSTCFWNYISVTNLLALAIWGRQQSIHLYSPCAQMLPIIRHRLETRPRFKDRILVCDKVSEGQTCTSIQPSKKRKKQQYM